MNEDRPHELVPNRVQIFSLKSLQFETADAELNEVDMYTLVVKTDGVAWVVRITVGHELHVFGQALNI